MEQILYAQVFKLRSKDLQFVAADKNKNEASQRWVDLELNWFDINFITREPGFYKKLFQSHDDTQENNTFKTFQVPIGNGKCVDSTR